MKDFLPFLCLRQQWLCRLIHTFRIPLHDHSKSCCINTLVSALRYSFASFIPSNGLWADTRQRGQFLLIESQDFAESSQISPALFVDFHACSFPLRPGPTWESLPSFPRPQTPWATTQTPSASRPGAERAAFSRSF